MLKKSSHAADKEAGPDTRASHVGVAADEPTNHNKPPLIPAEKSLLFCGAVI